MDKYRIEPFSLDKFSALKKLFKSTFHVDIDLDYFKKKYETEAIGGKAINYVAILNSTNEIVAHFAALPVKVIIDGKEVVAAQSCDAMTEAAHRKHGLFKRLAEEVHNACRQQGIAFVFSQPNEASFYPFLNVFNFKHVDDIIRWDLKTRIKTLPLGKFLVSTQLNKVYQNYCKMLLQSLITQLPNALTNRVHSNNARVLRDKAYLNYKQTAGTYILKIEQAIIWVKLADVFWIGEIEDYDKVNERVLKKLRQLAYRLGYNTISFHLNQKVPQPQFLKSFRRYKSEPSTVFYFDEEYKDRNLILTGVDFDTW